MVSCTIERKGLIDAQAKKTINDLPYDDRYDFPAKGFNLGKQLNHGIFAEVFRADAFIRRSIPGTTMTTTMVAKRAKNPPKDMDLKVLMKEVKILMYIGKHKHIVNLLGVVRENLADRKFCGFRE